uniref:Putative LOV domain-containing protein n=1 Tax=Sphaerocarpos texanus TaxID=37410 RepID=A0A126WXH6_9MARC|nr:putative LOV domain-containing protein [Sphaerocarpos texanus]
MTLKYGGSDQESDSDAEAPRAVSHSAATKRAVALTPNQRAGVSACEPPVDVEAQWRALLDGGALQPKPRPDEDEAEDHWQGVLSGGVEGSVVEDDERSMGRSSGTSSEYSEEAISEKAAQWGYEGPISASTELGDGMSVTSWRSRGSTRSMGSSSSGGSTSSQIPRVAKDVRDAITSFTLAFVVCDATGSPPTYPVLYASGGFFKMTGYEADEVIGSSCRFLQGPDTNPKEVARIRKALESGEAYSGKILNYKKDGTTFWNVLSMSPIKNNDGEVIKYIGMQAEAKGKRGKSHRRSLQSLPAEHSKIPRPISRAEVSVPRLSLPVPKDVVSGAAAAVQAPKSRYSYSLSNSRPSVDSAAEWQALARLRAEIVSSVRSMDAPEKDEKPSRKPRGSPATRLFRKLNTKISERLKTPEVEYVDYDTEEKVSSTFGGSDQDRNGNSVVFSRKYVDYRLDTPSEFRSDIPERGERLSSSHCKAPSVTVGGRSQFVIIH